MKLEFDREALLGPLQQVIGAVERRQTKPILGNVLLQGVDGRLQLTASDGEIQLDAVSDIETDGFTPTTLPARKLLDLCKNLPEGVRLRLSGEGARVTLSAPGGRFVLATLPAEEFPVMDEVEGGERIEVPQAALRRLIERTGFAMAQQDVRYFLNGLLLESRGEALRAVATDGHRLALYEWRAEGDLPVGQQAIVPRKAVLELARLLGDDEALPARLALAGNRLEVRMGSVRFLTKLIDGRFPDYERVIPSDGDKVLVIDRERFRQCLQLTAVLSSDKFRGVQLEAEPGKMVIRARNPEQEEAEEELDIEYDGPAITVAFNVNYLLDVLNVLPTEKLRLVLKDANGSCLLRADDDEDSGRYVVMPLRL